jgi:CHAT domain-containing protein
LPASRLEANDVRAALGGRAVIGAAATETAVRSALASNTVVHLATHGILNADNPMFSRLELAPSRGGSSSDDGRLEVHELLGLSIGADLVYLSGCETGKGASWRTGFDREEDFTTLAQAFLVAGAQNVVATLWRVDDPGAAAFARAFYRAWNGGDPAEALAAAQRTMLREPGHQAPYYWAAYQVTGAGRAGPAEALTVRESP